MALDMTLVPWLEKLLSITTFFTMCRIHPDVAKSECNMYCLDCNDKPSCSSCIKSGHTKHRVIQVRRSSHNDVVREADIKTHVDISGIQTYMINDSKVVFLNKRPYHPSSKKYFVKKSSCRSCERNLIGPSFYCSMACKLEWIKENDVVSEKHEERKTRSPSKSKREDKNLAEETLKRKAADEVEESAPVVVVPPPISTPRVSFRKPTSRRKGIPFRAPFF